MMGILRKWEEGPDKVTKQQSPESKLLRGASGIFTGSLVKPEGKETNI